MKTVHYDVQGPLLVPNLDHYKYYNVLFVEDYIHVAWVYLMKERSEVVSKFLLFINQICIQHSATLKIFRSDNAKEYTSTIFKNYFANNGIIHETSCTHAPSAGWNY